MATLTCQFVRPDRLLYEGEVAHVILVTHTGELGVWPLHAPEICALGKGVVRLALPEEAGSEVIRVLIHGGYAEITPTSVIILADHARRTDDIVPDDVRATIARAEGELAELASGDHRRAYWENKIEWCELLLQEAAKEA